MKNKKNMFITILLLTIGFAAVSTSLIINGNISFNTNEDDFDVYFSSAEVDNEDYTNEIISEDKQSITYETKNLSFIGDTSLLKYEVTNASKNYDAEVKVTCTGVSEEITLTSTPENQVILATEIGDGKVEIKLNKTVVDEKEIAFTCTLNVNAVERTTLGENEIANTDTYVIEGNYVDESGSAIANANLVIFSSTPHYVTTDENGYLFYNGLERGSHEIYQVEDTIENMVSMTKDEIISNAKTKAEFTTKTDGDINFSNNSILTNSKVITSKSYCEPLIGKTWEYNYTGGEQKFSTICDGIYKFEVWGAQGGNIRSFLGGKGAYVSGNLKMTKYSNLFIHVGGSGSNTATGGYNGGGSLVAGQEAFGSSGGGATDVRIISGLWDNFEGLKSRIIIAAGGGGANNRNTKNESYYGDGNGGYGGALIGGLGESINYNGSIGSYNSHYYGSGGTQTSGGITYHLDQNNNILEQSITGTFGNAYCQNTFAQSGGGSGYYSGAQGGHGGAGGGSSFISGHNGCDAIDESSTSSNIIHTGQANHYSGYVFTDTVMKAGNEKMPSHDGTSTITGNTGNGYARITLISLD